MPLALSTSSLSRVALIVYTSTLAGCASEADHDRYLRAPPPAEQVAGRWTALEGSLRDLTRRTKFTITQPERHQLELDASGTCRFRTHWQYSYVDAEDPEEASYYDTTSCAWSISSAGARVGNDRFEATTVQLHVRQGQRENFPVYYIAEQNGQLVLWQSIAEPGDGLFMDFVRVRPAE
jgi:hypothetical protein